MTELYADAVARVTALKDTEYTDFQARRMVEMAGHIIMGYLLLGDATRCADFTKSANVYVRFGEAEVNRHYKFITEFDPENYAAYYKHEA